MATSHLYIQSWVGWSNVEQIVLKTEKQIVKHNQPYTVINSTNNTYKRPNWVDSGDHWYFVSFYKALQEFNQKADYFVFVTGDIKCESWSALLDRMNSLLDNKIGSYSPYTNETLMSAERIGIKQLNENLDYSICQDGVMVAYRKDIAQELLEFFDFVCQKIDLHKLKYGWGVDVVAAVICMNKGLYMIKDNFIKNIDNSSSKLYEEPSVPKSEMNTILDLFIEFKGKTVEPLIRKIESRLEDSSLDFKNTSNITLDDFYI